MLSIDLLGSRDLQDPKNRSRKPTGKIVTTVSCKGNPQPRFLRSRAISIYIDRQGAPGVLSIAGEKSSPCIESGTAQLIERRVEEVRQEGQISRVVKPTMPMPSEKLLDEQGGLETMEALQAWHEYLSNGGG